jgi:hypothetical protein
MMRIYADPELDPQHWRKCTFLSFVSLWVAGRDYAYILFRGFIRGQFSNYSRIPERDNKANKYFLFSMNGKISHFCVTFRHVKVSKYTVTKKASVGLAPTYKAFF